MNEAGKSLYLNDKQIEFITARQPTKVFLAGRGAGKSAVIGPDTMAKARAMPRAKGFFASTTYNQILTKTLPEVINMWARAGLKEHESRQSPGHYVIGRRPPDHFVKPYAPPRKFLNVITFYNGFTIEMLSTDRVDLIRGGSYDYGYIDEAALISKPKFTKVLLPTVRGNVDRFGHHWAHQQIAFLTSVPWKATGQWILDYEQMARDEPGLYSWIEATAFDNVAVLGEKGLARLRREMTELEYRMEVLNERHVKLPDGFYHNLAMDAHTYSPTFLYSDDGPRGITTTAQHHKEYQASHPMQLSFDFGGWFTGVTVWQTGRQGRAGGVDLIERCIDLFYVKDDEKINELIDRFCIEYTTHRNKLAIVYGEPRGHDRNPQATALYDQIAARLMAKGWAVDIQVKAGYRAEDHAYRNHFINEILAETRPEWPKIRINEDKSKDLIFAMSMTPITKDHKKDKSKEKVREFPQQHAPHLTDTLDYFFTQKYGDLYANDLGGGDFYGFN